MNTIFISLFLNALNLCLKYFFGKKKYQPLFEGMLKMALKGMNIGSGQNFNTSGEFAALKYVKNKIKIDENTIIFDVGAHTGNYTILLAEIFGELPLIYSFEPSNITFKKLKTNTKHIYNIALHNIGFGEDNKKIIMYSNKPESGLASVFKRRLDHFRKEMNIEEEIVVKKIDSFCMENDIKQINFLKLDVEGNEYNALKGAINLIKNHKLQFTQFEFGGTNIDSKIFFQDFFYLLQNDYTIYRILNDGLQKIENYSELNEIFITTNYLAEIKNGIVI